MSTPSHIHTITIVQNAARLVTAETVLDTYRSDFMTEGEAADYAADAVGNFPWGWSCSCGMCGTGYRTPVDAAFNAPGEHEHITGRPLTTVIVPVPGGGGA